MASHCSGSLIAEHGLQGVRASVVAASRLESTSSTVMMRGLTCSEACGIFPHQGLNPRLLHWQADSLPLSHQGSPVKLFLLSFTYCSFWKEFSTCSPCLKRGDLCCFPLRMEYLHKLFGILLHGRFFFSFMYLIIYLCKYGLLHIYFILWDIIQCYFILYCSQENGWSHCGLHLTPVSFGHTPYHMCA